MAKTKAKSLGRVSVGLIGQLPRGNQGEIDLLILPYAERTVSDASLRIITSGQLLRIISFSRVRWTRDDNINLRFQVISGGFYPPEIEKSSVTAILLDTHGTKPGTITDAFEVKKKLYWQNPRRNRRIAEVAKRLALRTKRSIRSVVNGDTELVTLILEASSTGVAILVENPAHARELAELLPGWAVWTANDLEVKTPKQACGVITTELAADETVIHGEKVACGFLVTRRHASTVLEPIEQTFDLISFLVDRRIVRSRFQTVAPRRNQHRHALGLGGLDQTLAVVSFVREEVFRDETFHPRSGHLAVVHFSTTQKEPDRQAERVADHVDFGAVAADRTP